MLWEAISRMLPYTELYSLRDHEIVRLISNGHRPPLCDAMPLRLRELLQRCWHSDPVQRPSMAEVVDALEHNAEEIIPDDVKLLEIQTILKAKIIEMDSATRGIKQTIPSEVPVTDSAASSSQALSHAVGRLITKHKLGPEASSNALIQQDAAASASQATPAETR